MRGKFDLLTLFLFLQIHEVCVQTHESLIGEIGQERLPTPVELVMALNKVFFKSFKRVPQVLALPLPHGTLKQHSFLSGYPVNAFLQSNFDTACLSVQNRLL